MSPFGIKCRVLVSDSARCDRHFMVLCDRKMKMNLANSNFQPCDGAGISLATDKLPSVGAMRRATILQPPPIIAGLPSAVAWSHPTAEGVPSTAEFAGKQTDQRQGAKRQRRQVGGTKFDGRPGNAGAPQTELLQIVGKEGQNVCAFAPLRLCVEKSIFLQAGQRAGQWSDVVSIPVAG